MLRFTTGHRAKFWSHNVVGIGLATGFLEPLESTSIYLVQVGVGRLMTLLQRGGPVAPSLVDAYNTGLTRQFERIRDFILMHYCLTARRDTSFWQYMAGADLPETLAYKLHAWRETGALHQYDEEGFDGHSWLAIHAGMQNWPTRSDPTLKLIPEEQSLEWVRERAGQLVEAVRSVPTHQAYLDKMLGR
jgi:tryptophan halogenase